MNRSEKNITRSLSLSSSFSGSRVKKKNCQKIKNNAKSSQNRVSYAQSHCLNYLWPTGQDIVTCCKTAFKIKKNYVKRKTEMLLGGVTLCSIYSSSTDA